ncbi:MAG: MoaD/ThiS family protein [Candidatus Bathyarchaeia archaeon]|nr:MoaD/ThiS family protein [Candidatus Bathyarchaeota archaeon]
MRVKVTYLGVVRHKVGINEEEFVLPEGSTLKDLFMKIADAHDALKDLIGGLSESPVDPTLIVTLNGLAINLTSISEITLKDGDVLALMTVIGGG